MRLTFYYSEKDGERLVVDAIAAGVKTAGDVLEAIPVGQYAGVRDETDVVVCRGVKTAVKGVLGDHWKRGRPSVYFDKGYIRAKVTNLALPQYYRVAVNGFQPLHYFQKSPRPADRWQALGIELRRWRELNRHGAVIYAGSSQKQATWDGVGDATEFAERIIKKLDKLIGKERPIIYRPKPSWKDATPIEHSSFSRPPERIEDILPDAHCLITNVSNAAVDAIFFGIPVIVLGDGIAKPLANTSELNVQYPKCPTNKERAQWCHDLAYCQWTLGELRSGEAWRDLREVILS